MARRALVAALVPTLLGAFGALGAPAGGAATRAAVTVALAPSRSLEDQATSLAVDGLPPGALVTVSVQATDASGMPWRASATFVAARDGDVDVARAPSIAGSYTGVEPMGLISAMAPQDGGTEYFAWPKGWEPFQLTVTSGTRTLATRTFERRLESPGLAVDDETVGSTGFVGQFWQPAGDARHAAIVIIGGSEGGLDGQVTAAGFAAHGYPVLDLAYFGLPGLPSTLSSIPLEYFAGALRWVQRQRDVAPGRIFVLGESIGSEAALLLGAHYPNLVDGVIASAPDNFAFCSLPDCDGPAWTLGGQPIPYATYAELDQAIPTSAEIPVEAIRGPIFIDCGGVDPYAPCSESDAIVARLRAHGLATKATLRRFAQAGHGLNSLVPFDPGRGAAEIAGSTPQANAVADAQLWPELLSWLARASTG